MNEYSPIGMYYGVPMNRNEVEPMMLLTMRLHWFGTLGVR